MVASPALGRVIASAMASRCADRFADHVGPAILRRIVADGLPWFHPSPDDRGWRAALGDGATIAAERHPNAHARAQAQKTVVLPVGSEL